MLFNKISEIIAHLKKKYYFVENDEQYKVPVLSSTNTINTTLYEALTVVTVANFMLRLQSRMNSLRHLIHKAVLIH